jgi:predicted N-acetyltransferase YhbS
VSDEIVIREATPADHPRVRACMDEVFRETGGQKIDAFGRELWEWQYLGPEEPSLVVVADDGARLCGYFHALVLRMRRDGRELLGAMVQDVGTLAAYRGRGIFRRMGAHALELLAARGVELVYTFPNERSRPSFERNHAYDLVARVPVLLTPLRPTALVVAQLGRSSQRGRHGGPLAAARTRRARLPQNAEVRQEPAITDEVAAVADESARAAGVSLVRSARHLTWRFLEKPGGGYACWTLREHGAPVAFLVTARSELFGSPCLVLMDLGAPPDRHDALLALVGARLAAEQEQGAALALTMGLHPALPALWRHGFVRVPERVNPRPFNLLTKLPGAPGPSGLADPRRWLVTLADWDVL